MRKLNRIEAIEKIETSFVNGNFTQAREQIVDAIENKINPLNINFEYCQEGLEQFVNKTIINYLANTPRLEARQLLMNY